MDGRPVCITGMHRSGTSMVTNILRLCGLYLGPDDRLLPSGHANPDGYWEHSGFVAINDELLGTYNAAWDWPPPESVRWDNREVLSTLEQRSRTLVSGFLGADFWGWKDPRTSLTMPFWQRILPQMPVVVCVRNPLEVALSLHDRNEYTLTLGLNLWKIYNERLLRETDRKTRIITHYDAFFSDADRQIQRLLDFLGLTSSDQMIEDQREVVRRPLRHRKFDIQDLGDIGLAADLLDLYAELCREADWFDHEGGAGEQVLEAMAGQRRSQVFSLHAASAEAEQGMDESQLLGSKLPDSAIEDNDGRAQPGYFLPSVNALLRRGEVEALRGQLASRVDKLDELSNRLSTTEAQLKLESQLRRALNEELVLLREIFWTVAPRLVVAGITHAAIDSVAGQSANGPHPITIEAGQPVTIEGWAVDTEAGSTATGVLIAVDEKQRFWATYGKDRPDVADAFSQPAFERCGFSAELPAGILSPGPHTLTLEVLAKGRPAYYNRFPSAGAGGAAGEIEIVVTTADDR